MAIHTAVQKGNIVYVYDEKGNVLFTKNGTLQGFTVSTVSIKTGSSIYLCDERGEALLTK